VVTSWMSPKQANKGQRCAQGTGGVPRERGCAQGKGGVPGAEGSGGYLSG